VLHDCLPANRLQQLEVVRPRTWTGGVWKVIAAARQVDGLAIAVGDFDHGCGIVFVRPGPIPSLAAEYPGTYRWADYQGDRVALLNVNSWDDLERWIDGGPDRK
jgi:hypothetical protein